MCQQLILSRPLTREQMARIDELAVIHPLRRFRGLAALGSLRPVAEYYLVTHPERRPALRRRLMGQ